MFTGIVKACVPVATVIKKPGLISFAVRLPEAQRKNLSRGASIAIDGVCLTVIHIKGAEIWFDVMRETMRKTTLGAVISGRRVNVERSARLEDEIGGHLLSGHITDTALIIKVESPRRNRIVTFQLHPKYVKYILPKGFIALDGSSLTIVKVNRARGTFTAHLIPETIRATTFGFKKRGDYVNVEIDSRTQTIVDTVEQVLRKKL